MRPTGCGGWMRRASVVALLMALVWVGAASAVAATVRVCPSGCRYRQIASAVAAAHAGDVIVIAAGSYRGGFMIDKSLTLRGAGAGRATIRGGGPVLTIGRFGASREPTVSISGLTITGGVTRSSALSSPKGEFALGGGIEIPPNAHFDGGARETTYSGHQPSPPPG